MNETREIINLIMENALDKFKAISIYGTGDGAHLVYGCINELGLLNNLKFIIDRDDSNTIGKKFENLEIKRIGEVLYNTDIIIIAAKNNRAIVKERIEDYLAAMKVEIVILDIFNKYQYQADKNTQEDCKKYVEFIEQKNYVKRVDFVDITKTPYKLSDDDTKIIAFYLPQYYQIDVNNKYHGQGFTEWTNSSQAIPLFTGHYQPHIPYDVGYYDLTNINVMKRQIELAKMYGIYGFCFHYYWFSGQRIMEKPIEMLLKHKELNIPFCFNWATENWTSIWDGGSYDIIFEQKLMDQDDSKFMDDIIPYMKDERYIKIKGCPVLIIYTCKMFEKRRFQLLMHNFRKHAIKAGFPDLYVLLTNYGDFDDDVEDWGADALVEFPPAGIHCTPYKPEGYINPYFEGNIHDLKQYVNDKMFMRNYKSKKVFKTAMVSFDNTARKAIRGGHVFIDGSPLVYQQWLNEIIQNSKNLHNEEDGFIFVNSWNEWAEGCHLEPDMKYGYGFLEATKNALTANRNLNEKIILNQYNRLMVKNITEIHFYIHCIESLGDIVACEPIARFLKSLDGDISVTWIIRKEYREIIQNNPYIDNISEVECLSDSIDICNNLKNDKSNIIIDCHYNGRRCRETDRVHVNMNNPQVNENTYFNYGNILETFCLSAGLPKLINGPRFYLEDTISLDWVLPADYIVFHCKSAEECKDWTTEKWIELATRLLDNGYQIVEIGLSQIINVNRKGYHDLTDCRSIQKLAYIISNAKCFVGIDSAFAHIANCFHVSGIIIMGKYKNFERPMPYSGNYAKGINSKIIYADNKSASAVNVDDVLDSMISHHINIL